MFGSRLFGSSLEVKQDMTRLLWQILQERGNLSRYRFDKIVRAQNTTQMILELKSWLAEHRQMSSDVILAIIDLVGGLEMQDGQELVRHIAGLMRWGYFDSGGKREIFHLLPPAKELEAASADFFRRSLRLYETCSAQRDDFLCYGF